MQAESSPGSPAPQQTELAAAWITLWWPLGPGGGGPLAAQPGDRASSPCQNSGCSISAGEGWSRAPGAAPGAARSPQPEPLTCLSILGSQGWARLWLWLCHCPSWPELLQAQGGEFLGSPVLQQLPGLQQLCLPHARGLLHVSFLFPLLVWTGLLLILSVH